MKKYIYSALVLGLMVGVTACDTDRDDNPVLTQATEFHLNTPAFSNQVFDIATSNALNFTYSQPNWEFPLVVDYTLQFSLTNTFTTSVDEAEADETATKVADYQESDRSNESLLSVPAATFAKGLQQIGKWAEDAVPATVKVYARVKAIPAQYSIVDRDAVAQYAIYSNTVEFTLAPCYVELADAPIKMWYLVGNLFGGKWGSAVGETALPMFVVPDYAYDKKTGTGEITYTNYFITGDYDNTAGNESSTAGFKIQPDDFNWDLGMTGNSGAKGEIIYRNKGEDGGHIVAPADGYYKLTMNTEKLTATLEPIDAPAKTFTSVCLSGSFNGWSDTEMNAYNKEGIENHTWYLVVDFDAEQEVKFKEAGSWDSNWGAATFPTGVGQGNGANILVPAGKWVISFCDITGEYSILAL